MISFSLKEVSFAVAWVTGAVGSTLAPSILSLSHLKPFKLPAIFSQLTEFLEFKKKRNFIN